MVPIFEWKLHWQIWGVLAQPRSSVFISSYPFLMMNLVRILCFRLHSSFSSFPNHATWLSFLNRWTRIIQKRVFRIFWQNEEVYILPLQRNPSIRAYAGGEEHRASTMASLLRNATPQWYVWQRYKWPLYVTRLCCLFRWEGASWQTLRVSLCDVLYATQFVTRTRLFGFTFRLTVVFRPGSSPSSSIHAQLI